MTTNIQWFPGHMAKARREVQEKLKFVDIVLELVDARIPQSSRNPMLDKIIQQKPRLILLNKIDLARITEVKKWQEYFAKHDLFSLTINSLDNKTIKKIIPQSKKILADKIKRDQERGLKIRGIRAMIVGIPNVGKSTLMNHLVGKKKAQVGNTPGVTKAQQWLKLGQDLELLDTPGILWPKFDDSVTGLKLALTGAIKDSLVHADDLALYALQFFCETNPAKLIEYFDLIAEDLQLKKSELLMLITQKLGFKEDYDLASKKIIKDIRDGKLGHFTLDDFSKMESELEEK